MTRIARAAWCVLTAVAAFGPSAAPVSAVAQADPVHRHDARRVEIGTPHWHGLSAGALAQIRHVTEAVAHLDSPEAARAAGFRPALGLIPTMGVHWVNRARMRDGEVFSLDRPDHLMFAPLNGEQKLVGIAFAYRGAVGGVTPEGFDGDQDVWHDHPQLAGPGQTLTMLHVWFVPSPDGPFAGHNPWLPYWAVGLEPPDESELADPQHDRRVRMLALALAETVGETNIVEIARRLGGPALEERLAPRRAAIRALIPQLAAARAAGDDAVWNRLADEANAEWQQIRDAYLEAIPLPRARQQLVEFFDEMLTGHGHGTHSGH